jgi:hypothetical protein
MPLVYWVELQREVSTYGGQYSTQNSPCVLGGTPSRGLYLRKTIEHTDCPLCIGWDSNARFLLTEDNTAHKMPLVYWVGLQRHISTYGDNKAQKMPLVYWVGRQRKISTYGGQYSTENAPCVLGGISK